MLGYQMYFCQPGCATPFEQDAVSAVLAMSLPAQTPSAEPGPDPKLVAKLAKADLLDGMEDKVVTRCAMCALSMDGMRDFTVKAAGYELLFCRQGCIDAFSEDVNKSILSLNVPD